LVLCLILFILLRYITKAYYKEFDIADVNKHIFTEFLKQTTEVLSEETIIICLKNAVKICVNKNLIHFTITPVSGAGNEIIENNNECDIAAKILYKQYIEDNKNNEEGEC
jgi:hypothetical protein